MEDRYPLCVVAGDPCQVSVEFKNRGARATFSYDPVTDKVKRTGVYVDSPALDISAIQYIGFGPLQNAMDRATRHFKQKRDGADAFLFQGGAVGSLSHTS